MSNDKRGPARDGELLTRRRTQLKRPPRYQVIFHNDDYTTQIFVVDVLQRFFHKSYEEAHQLMMTIHKAGKGVAGVYPFDIAETKRVQVEQLAAQLEMPLRLTLEAE